LNDKSLSSAPAPHQRKPLTDNRILDFPKHIPEISLRQAKSSGSNDYPATIHLPACHYSITGAFTGGEIAALMERELSSSSSQSFLLMNCSRLANRIYRPHSLEELIRRFCRKAAPPHELVLPLMNDKDWTRRVPHNVFGCAAQQDMLESVIFLFQVLFLWGYVGKR
jgi:hypothetical protein